MDMAINISFDFFSHKEIRNASNDMVVLYLAMRSTTKEDKITPLGLKELAVSAGIADLTANRHIFQLLKMGWIKKTDTGHFQLGQEEYFLDIITKRGRGEIPDLTTLRDKVKEDEKTIIIGRARPRVEPSKSFSKKVFKDEVHTCKVSSKDILLTFSSLYKQKFKIKPPMIEEGPKSSPYQTTYVYIKRAIQYCDGDAEATLKVVEFMFEKWDQIRKALRLDPVPTYNLLGSSRLFPQIIACFTSGIPEEKRKPRFGKDVSDRYDKESASKHSDVGW